MRSKRCANLRAVKSKSDARHEPHEGLRDRNGAHIPVPFLQGYNPALEKGLARAPPAGEDVVHDGQDAVLAPIVLDHDAQHLVRLVGCTWRSAVRNLISYLLQGDHVNHRRGFLRIKDWVREVLSTMRVLLSQPVKNVRVIWAENAG
jgi:hypothetical protein